MSFWDDILHNAYVTGNASSLGNYQNAFGSEGKFKDIASGTVAGVFGGMPMQIDQNAPGGSLDTSYADAERDRMQGLLQQLQQQATTGNGAWQDTLHNAIANAQNTASAVGQSQANQQGGNAASALRDIGNAQSAATQRGVQQGDILRTESKQNAQDELSQLEPAMGAGDISQSAQASAIAQQNREANLALRQQASQTLGNTVSGAGQAVGTAAALFSDGGRVPGIPFIMGDDSRNDNVPALLSPEEIVVPISAAKDPNKAADFARAVAERGLQKKAGGGPTDPGTYGLSFGDIPIGLEAMQQPSIENGGLLDTSNYNGLRGGMDTLTGQLESNAAGGNSIADTVAKQQQDTVIQQAMAQRNQAEAIKGAAIESAKGAGEAGQKRLADQSKGQRSVADLLEQRRAQEQALANAEQGAAFNNTMMDAGVNLSNQQALRGIASGAGQAALGVVSAQRGADQPFSAPPMVQADTGFSPGGYPSGPDQGEGSAFGPSGSGDTWSPPNYDTGEGMAHGGMIQPMEDDERTRMHKFLRQLGRKAA